MLRVFCNHVILLLFIASSICAQSSVREKKYQVTRRENPLDNPISVLAKKKETIGENGTVSVV